MGYGCMLFVCAKRATVHHLPHDLARCYRLILQRRCSIARVDVNFFRECATITWHPDIVNDVAGKQRDMCLQIQVLGDAG